MDKWIGTIVAGALFLLSPIGSAWADTIADCTPSTCGWEITVDGQPVMEGMYQVDPDTGDISFGGTGVIEGDGYTVELRDMYGNIDPVLGFGLGATNTSGAFKTFAFGFSLPLGGLSVPIQTEAQLGTTLTAFSNAGGSVVPVLGGGKIVDSQDIVINPFASVDKGVDIGDGLSINTQGGVLNNETATGSILAGGPFDLMSVTVAFGLTDQTGVGFSGFVEQTAIPVPAAFWLFGSGLLGLIGIARRKKTA